MKQYVIDGLRFEDFKKIEAYFQKYLDASQVEGIFWLEISDDVLTLLQQKHSGCGPHVFALMLEHEYLSCELLVRIKRNIKCDCMGYATKDQREWLFETIDSILNQLEIQV